MPMRFTPKGREGLWQYLRAWQLLLGVYVLALLLEPEEAGAGAGSGHSYCDNERGSDRLFEEVMAGIAGCEVAGVAFICGGYAGCCRDCRGSINCGGRCADIKLVNAIPTDKA